MTDWPRSGSPTDPNESYADPYPAYAGSSPDSPSYWAGGLPAGPTPTEQLPQYWTQTTNQPPWSAPPPEPPDEPPGTPRWLWVTAGFAVMLVVGLVVALLLRYANPSTQETAIIATESTTAATTPSAPGTTRRIPPTRVPMPTLTRPTPSTAPGETETVVYEITGDGSAFNITYVDTDNLMQTEFNVDLPWSKEVILPKPAKNSASVIVTNAGSEITCRITIEGAPVIERTGAVLTLCAGI